MDTIGADGTAVSISGSIRTVCILILIVPPGVVCHCAISFAHGTDENTISLLAQSGAHDKTQSNAGIRIVPHFLQAASSTAAAANGLFQSSCRQQAVVLLVRLSLLPMFHPILPLFHLMFHRGFTWSRRTTRRRRATASWYIFLFCQVPTKPSTTFKTCNTKGSV